MRRVLSRLIPSPALGVAVVALVLAAGGITYAATSGEGVIRACANKRTGALRVASRCKRNERRVSWSIVGPQGLRGQKGNTGNTGARGFTGAPGAAGAPGSAGKEGPQGTAGPGATTFTGSIVNNGPNATLATLKNGVSIVGSCAGEVTVHLVTAPSGTLQTSGVATKSEKVLETFETTVGTERTLSATGAINFAGLVRDSAVGKFAHLDIHGQFGPSCTYWGMEIPSS